MYILRSIICKLSLPPFSTIPVTIDAPQGAAAWKDFVGDSGSTLDLTPHIGAPIGNKEDIEASICAAVSFGPAINLHITREDFPSVDILLGARIDLPRVEFCGSYAQGKSPTITLIDLSIDLAVDVDADCNPGPFEDAIKLEGNISVGLVAYGHVTAIGIEFVKFEEDAEELGLYKEWTIIEHCWGIGDGNNEDGNNNNDTPPPISPISTFVPPPNSGNNNYTAPGYDNGLYNCDSVAPSPGGQPCGVDVVMACPSTYTWSCGNGVEGAVPPGTFCAW